MKTIILFVLATMAAFGQAQTPLTIGQSSGSATGELRMQERRTNGQNYVGIAAPDSVATSYTWRLPGAEGTFGQYLRTDGAGLLSWGSAGDSGASVIADDYDWTQTITAPGAAGTHTVTLTPGPLGVVATDTVSLYWLIGTAGASEAVASTGTGTCDGTGQASCTLEIVTANSHTGTTTIQSGSAGAQEAINYITGGYVTLRYPKTAACIDWNTEVNLRGKAVSFIGEGFGSCVGLLNSGQRGIVKTTDDQLVVKDLTINGQGDTIAIYADPPASNNDPDIIERVWFYSHDIAIQHRAASNVYITKNLFWLTRLGVDAGNERYGDQGGLYITGNTMLGITSTTGRALSLHAAAATFVENNSFVGYRDQIYIDGRMAVVDTSGTTVTATSDYTFSTLVTTGVTVYINGSPYVVSTRDSATQLTLAASAGTQSGVDLGVFISQMRFNDNNFDNTERTSIHIAGTVPVGTIEIAGGHFQRTVEQEDYQAVKITNANATTISVQGASFSDISFGTTSPMTGIYATYVGRNFVARGNTFTTMKYGITLDLGATALGDQDGIIEGNQYDSAGYLTVGRGIYVKNALGFRISDNNIHRANQGIVIDGGSSNHVTANNNTISCTGTTPVAVDVLAGNSGIIVDGVHAASTCAYGLRVNASVVAGAVIARRINVTAGAATARISAGVSTQIVDDEGTTFANLPTNSRDGSMVYCSDCVSSSVGVCAGSGSGAYAARLNGAWTCAQGTNGQWTISGANIYYPSTGNVGIGIAPSTRLTLGGGAGANTLQINHGAATSNLNITVESTYSVLGTYTATDLLFATDSASRWRLNSAGMFVPATTDMYDFGIDAGPRVRALYSKIVDTAISGGTGDYVRTRKMEMVDAGGATGSWSVTANATTGTSLYEIRDNSGSRWLRGYRAISSTPTNDSFLYANLIPAGRTIAGGDAVDDATLPELGNTGNRWAKGWVNSLYASWYAEDVKPLTNTIVLGGESDRWANVYSVNGNYTGIVGIATSATAPAAGYKLDIESADNTDYGGALIIRPANRTQTLEMSWAGIKASNKFGITWTSTYDMTFNIGATNVWLMNSSGHLLPGAHNTYTIGVTGTRPSKIWAVDLDVSGTCTGCGSGSTPPFDDATAIIKGSADATKLLAIEVDGLTTGTTRTLTPQNASYTIAGTNLSQTFSNTQTFSGDFQVTGTGNTAGVVAHFIPKSNDTYTLGSATYKWNTVYTYDFNIYGNAVIDSAATWEGNILSANSTVYSFGNSTNKWNAYLNNTYFYGNIQAPSGSNGQSTTITVRDSAGTGTCTIIFSGGLKTGGTC